LQGKDGIANFYRDMFKTVRENLTIHQFVADENGIAADITTQFTAIEDAPNFVVGALKKGNAFADACMYKRVKKSRGMLPVSDGQRKRRKSSLRADQTRPATLV
jgi:hypothetical protein